MHADKKIHMAARDSHLPQVRLVMEVEAIN